MRRGTTLVELLVALVLLGLVLGVAAKSLLVQQRAAHVVAGAGFAVAQSHVALRVMASQAALVVPAAGDLAGLLTDTALQLRVPVAVGVTCEGAVGSALLVADAGSDAPVGAVTSPPRSGDSLWWYVPTDARWYGRRVVDVAPSTGRCAAVPGALTRLRVRFAGTDTIGAATPARITRQLRYDFYRASDGSWQLGSRDWSEPTQRFAAPQPIAGPFVRAGSRERRTGFRFFDAGGGELDLGRGPIDPSRVALIRVTVATGAGGDGASVAESRDVALRRHGG